MSAATIDRLLAEARGLFASVRGSSSLDRGPIVKTIRRGLSKKNGSVVRRLVGYRRLERTAAAGILARLYTASGLFVNSFQPSFKLKEKFRVGGCTVKRYDPPQTPWCTAIGGGYDAASGEGTSRGTP